MQQNPVWFTTDELTQWRNSDIDDIQVNGSIKKGFVHLPPRAKSATASHGFRAELSHYSRHDSKRHGGACGRANIVGQLRPQHAAGGPLMITTAPTASSEGGAVTVVVCLHEQGDSRNHSHGCRIDSGCVDIACLFQRLFGLSLVRDMVRGERTIDRDMVPGQAATHHSRIDQRASLSSVRLNARRRRPFHDSAQDRYIGALPSDAPGPKHQRQCGY